MQAKIGFPLAASSRFKAPEFVMAERTLAICMSQQARLGSSSALGTLDGAILQVISQYASMQPEVSELARYVYTALL